MSKTKRLQTIDGESLMSLPLTPLNFVVDTLLSQGLHILAGSPKGPLVFIRYQTGFSCIHQESQ